MTDVLGLPVRESVLVDPGSPVVLYGSVGEVQSLVMHPLDRIAIEHPAALDRLTVAMTWITTRAHRRLDNAAERMRVRS